MFRRTSKITSLLIVAASVMSLVPATASIKLTNLNGYFNNAIAFDGGYAYSGYKDTSEDGIYYYKYNDKDKFIENSEYDLSGQYGNQYAVLAASDSDDDDELLKLSSGEIDEDSQDGKAFDAKRSLQKVLKKTEKYGDDLSIGSIDLNEIDNGTKTGEPWYKYKIETTSAAVNVETTSAAVSYGYTNSEGDYVEISDIANIYAYSSEENKMVRIDKFDSVAKKDDGTDNYDKDTYLRAKLIDTPEVIAQDKDNIYQKISVDLYDYSQNAITPEGQTTVSFNLTSDNVNANLPGQMTPANGVYSLPYVAVRDFSTLTSGASYTFDGKSYIYTTDTTLANTSGNTYFCDMNTLKTKILANDSNFSTTTDFNGKSTIMDDRKSGTDSNGKYVFYPKIYVNTSINCNLGPAISTKTLSYVTTNYPQYPFYDLDRGTIANFTINDNSAWKEVDNVFIYSTMKENNVASSHPSTLTRWPSSANDKIDASQSLTTYYLNQPAGSTSGGTGLLTVNPNVFNGGSTVKIGNKLTFTYNPIGTGELEFSSINNLKQKLCKYLDNHGISSLTDIAEASYSYDSNYNLTLKFSTGQNKVNADKAEVEFSDFATIDSDIDHNEGLPIFPTVHTYIQKISKAQGKASNGIYAAKNVDSYEITNAYDSDEASLAVDLLDKGGIFTTVNGKLQYIQNTAATDGKLTVTSLNLKKDNVAFDGESLPSTSDNFDETQKVSTNLVEVDVKSKGDIDITAATAYDTDVEGNVWAVNNGTIYKYDGERFRGVYTCGTLYDHLSVYDKNNLVTWNTNGTTSYTSVIDGEKQTIDNASALTGKVMVTDTLDTTTNTAITPNSNVVGTPGWNKTSDGNWYFCDSTGTKLTNKWCYYNGGWYYLKADGTMATGWLQDSGKWYYMGDDGTAKYGWVNVNSNWYYLNTLGDMATGWINDEGKWYYLSESGSMLYNTTVNGYNLGSSGEIVSSSWIN